MLKIQEIRELIKLVNQSDLDEFVYEFNDGKIKMKKNRSYSGVPQQEPQAQQAPVQAVKEEIETPVNEVPAAPAKEAPAPAPAVTQDQAAAEDLHSIKSPMVGTFYQAPSPDADPYVRVGSKVSKNSIVCIVEAMKLFNEIEAEVNGEIVEILVKDGQLVEYGQPLFLVRPE